MKQSLKRSNLKQSPIIKQDDLYSLSSVVSPLLARSHGVGAPGAELHCRYLQGKSRTPKQKTKEGELCGLCLASALLPLGHGIILLKFHPLHFRVKTEPQIKEPFLWPGNSSFRNSYLRNNPRETKSWEHRVVIVILSVTVRRGQ